MPDGRDVPNGDLLDQLAEDFKNELDVTMGTMFRSPGLRVGGKIFAFLGHDGELIVKLSKNRVQELVATGTADQVTMGKRTMREWITIPANGNHIATLALWRGVAREAYEYVDALRHSS